MNTGARIVRNTGILIAMELVGKAFEVVVSIVVARKLGPSGLGLLAFAVSFVSLFAIFVRFGMATLVYREVARTEDRLNAYLSNGLLLKLGLSMLAFSAVFIFLKLARYPADKMHIVLLACLVMFLESYIGFGDAFFRAFQKMQYSFLINFVLTFFSSIVGIGVVFAGYGIREFLFSRLIIYGLGFLFVLYLINRRLHKITFEFEPAFCVTILKKASPFLLYSIFVAIYVQVDMVMLAFMKTDEITGFYAAAQKFRKLFSFIPLSLIGATIPAMAKFSRTSLESLIKTVEHGFKYLLLVALPAAVGIAMLAGQIILLFYGRSYEPSILSLRILIWTIIFAFLNTMLASTLVSLDKEKQAGYCMGIGALFNIVSNFFFIPFWSFIGASITTVLSEAIVFILQYRLLRRILPAVRPWRLSQGPGVCTVVMAIFIAVFCKVKILFLIPLSVFVYLTALFITKTLGAEEFRLIREIIKKK